jgi:single-strand DNA-binding protein
MLNRVILIGRLTKDPELRHTQSGKAVANFTLAVDRDTKGKQADFIPVVAWNNTAEACATYLVKGSLVYVEGGMQVSNYEDKDGIKRYKTEVIARNVKFLEFKKGEGKKEPAYDEKGNELMEVPF